MSLVVFLTVLATLFVLIAFGQPLARRLKLSFTVLLALAGIAIGGGAAFFIQTPITDALNPAARAVLDLPIHSEAFLYIFLPTLLFQVALTLDLRRMVEDWVPILVMAVVAAGAHFWCSAAAANNSSDFSGNMSARPQGSGWCRRRYGFGR